jgi:hypothetical protein
MLLPDNIQPELCIYYNGALVLQELQNNSVQLIIDLYHSVKEKYDMSFPIFTLSLDWLFLIDVAKSNEKGEIELCS